MPRWEIANIQWEGVTLGKRRYVDFSHRPKWDKIGGDQLMETMRQLGDMGFELVGQVHTDNPIWNAWWFKRPLEESEQAPS